VNHQTQPSCFPLCFERNVKIHVRFILDLVLSLEETPEEDSLNFQTILLCGDLVIRYATGNERQVAQPTSDESSNASVQKGDIILEFIIPN
jgi:hypothetical protein